MLNSKQDRIMSEVTTMDFPRVIMVEVLSRLPIKPIFRCKTVCKSWYILLTSDPLFVKMHHERSSSFPSILLSHGHSNLSLLELKEDYDYYSLPHNRPVELSTNFHLPIVESNISLIGSCNGFICLLNGLIRDENHSVCINNPLLGEYFKLKLPELEKNVCRVAYGFCFSEAFGQYKVLRLVVRNFEDRPQASELEVYTLGVDEKWRNVGQVPCPLWYNFGNVNINGSLHSIDGENLFSLTTIYSFNIGTEEVKPLPAPPGLKTTSFGLTLVELGNCLCLTANYGNGYVDIWWMKEYGIAESWTKDRILTDSTLLDIRCRIFTPILIWKDGEILMQGHRGTQLNSYNPKENKLRKINVYGNDTATAEARYIPSFYSLRTVMGDSFQVSNVYHKTKFSF